MHLICCFYGWTISYDLRITVEMLFHRYFQFSFSGVILLGTKCFCVDNFELRDLKGLLTHLQVLLSVVDDYSIFLLCKFIIDFIFDRQV